ncbi:hypothetical protein LZ31DRAFT_92557 [Colletotrichum somersetense]|nr:hypothetical protein LZ31DRAFT_92557 [Colletotrichum somersetense]
MAASITQSGPRIKVTDRVEEANCHRTLSHTITHSYTHTHSHTHTHTHARTHTSYSPQPAAGHTKRLHHELVTPSPPVATPGDTGLCHVRPYFQHAFSVTRGYGGTTLVAGGVCQKGRANKANPSLPQRWAAFSIRIGCAFSGRIWGLRWHLGRY